jgi:hypothetical protein
MIQGVLPEVLQISNDFPLVLGDMANQTETMAMVNLVAAKTPHHLAQAKVCKILAL